MSDSNSEEFPYQEKTEDMSLKTFDLLQIVASLVGFYALIIHSI